MSSGLPPSSPPPPPAPPPLPPPSSESALKQGSGCSQLPPPVVPKAGPAGAYLVELLVYDGRPFKDHWAYWVRSSTYSPAGIYVHATGDVRAGFVLEVKRGHDVNASSRQPAKQIPLQWVAGTNFEDSAQTFNNGESKHDNSPVCEFERSAFKVEAPGKSLNSADTSGQKVTHRNCQTWIVESADQLVKDGIFTGEVAAFLRAFEQ